MIQGRFVTFEGSEGAGKSSNLEWCAQWLRARGLEVVTTREPGGTDVGEQIRGVLLNPDLPTMHPDTELLLMFAARHEHVTCKILPALQQGKWVLCDRFTDATYAYQGYGRGLSQERIAILEQWVQGSLRPNHTILFDIDVSIGMQRAKKRGASDRFEQEQMDFFERIRAGYLARAKVYPQQYVCIDAAQSLEKVRLQLEQVLEQFIVESTRP